MTELKDMVCNDLTDDCPVVSADLKNAHQIFLLNLTGLRGRMGKTEAGVGGDKDSGQAMGLFAAA